MFFWCLLNKNFAFDQYAALLPDTDCMDFLKIYVFQPPTQAVAGLMDFFVINHQSEPEPLCL